MAKTANLNIRIEPEIKSGAEELFRSFGITVDDAINIFLHQSLIIGGLPFELKRPKLRVETEEAIKECEEMLASGNYISYGSVQELHEAIMADGDEIYRNPRRSV